MNTRLQKAREASGKTQAQVAKEIGVSEPMYQRYEYGINKPRVDTAISIAAALGVTVEQIFGTGNQCRAGSSERPTR